MDYQHCEIVLQATAHDAITTEGCQRLPLESGGILLGYHEDQRIIITDALIVTTADATTNRYTRHDVQANEQLREYLAARDLDDPIGYIGEWHSHPAPSGPSSIDLKAIRATARATAGSIALMVYSPPRTPAFSAVIAARQRVGRIILKEVTVGMPDQHEADIAPLPDDAVRGDGPVFISYRQSDGSDRADSLEGLLRAAGLVVWRDRSDLRAGTTTDRLKQALTSGLSAGVLIVTPDIAKSSIVKERELPRLLHLDQDSAFSLSIANEIPSPTDPDRPNFAAPDCLLGLAPAYPLRDKKQSDTRTLDGRLEIVRDLLMHRIEQRKTELAASGGVLTIITQTRPEPSAMDADQSDLHVRIKPAATGRLPSTQGLQDLQATLPLTGDAVRASGASTVRIAGGMHLSVALAIGAALAETKIGHAEVIDLRHTAWTSKTIDDPLAARVRLTPKDSIEPGEAGRLSVKIAQEIKRISAQFGRAEIHLAYHGPYTMAVLIGRFLNTLRTVVYEWDNPEDIGPTYTPVLTLEPGAAGGPIMRVHL
jgi:integrative and conjugative element protein (TIGR02256 family)